MTFRFEDQEADAMQDGLLAEVMDDFLAECDPAPARFLSVLNNGREYKVKVDGNVLWFPNVGRKAK